VLERDGPSLIIEVNDRMLQACGSSRGEIQAALARHGYTLYAIDDATARLEPLGAVDADSSENVVGLRDDATP
jgi:hypothetical protein